MIIIHRKKVKMEWWIYHHKPPIRTWQLIRAGVGPGPGHVTSVLCAACEGWGEFPKTMSFVSDFLAGAVFCVITLSGVTTPRAWLVTSLTVIVGYTPNIRLSIEQWELFPTFDRFSVNVLNWPEDGVVITLAPPRGWHVVRAGPQVEAGTILIRARDGIRSCNV